MDRRYYVAAEKFAEKYKNRKDVLGILIVGSIVIREPDKNSDVDMYIIVDKAKTRIRGNTEIDGIEIEYFINPVEQVRAYFKNETGRHTAHMLSHSLTLHKKSPVVDELIKEAKWTLKQKLPAMAPVQKSLAVYELDDLRKDLEDAHVKKDAVAERLLSAKIVGKCVEHFYAVKRLPKEKEKRLLASLKAIDPEFARLVARADDYAAVLKLIRYTEKLIGGQRKKEWRLEGPLKL